MNAASTTNDLRAPAQPAAALEDEYIWQNAATWDCLDATTSNA